MARTIIIRIVVDNRDAINAAKAQAIAQKTLRDEIAAGNSEMRKAEQHAANMAKAQNEASKATTDLSSNIVEWVVKARLANSAYNLLISTIRNSVSHYASLELSLAKVAAVTGSSREQLSSLNKLIYTLGSTTAVSNTEIASAALELSKLGFSGKTLETSLAGVTRLASILGDSLETTGNLVGGVIQTFDLSADEATKVADKLFVATGKSALNIEGFRVAFALAGNVAHDAGISFDELSSVIAALSNQGIRASTIGTGLRSFISDLSREGSKAQLALGGSIEDMGLVGAMKRLAELKLAPGSIVEIFGKPSSPVVSGLGHAQEAYAKFIEEIKNSEGTLEKTKGLINDTLLGATQLLINNFDRSVAGFGSGVADAVKRRILDLVSTFQEANERIDFFNNEKAAGRDPYKTLGTTFVGYRMKTRSEQEELVDSYLKAQKDNNASKFSMDDAFAEQNASRYVPKENPIVKATKLAKDNTKELQNNISKIKESFQEYQAGGLDPFNFKTSEVELEKIRDHFKDVGKFKEANQAQSLISQLQAYEGQDAKQGFAKNKSAYQEDAAAARDKKKSISTDNSGKASEMDQYLEGLQTQLDEFNQALEQTKIAFDSIDGGLKTLSSEMVDSLFSWEWSWTHFGYVVKDIFKNLVKDFIAMEIRIFALKAAIKIGGYLASAYTGGASIAASDVAAGAVEEQGREQFFNSAVRATDGIAATGFDGYVSGAKRFIAGESGMERVTITPMNKPEFYANNGNGGGMTIIVQGDVFNPERLVDKVNRSNELSKSRYV